MKTSSPTIRLVARFVSGEVLAEITVCTNMTVAELKAQITKEAGLKDGITVQALAFHCWETAPADTVSLQDCGLSDGDELVAICGRAVIGSFAPKRLCHEYWYDWNPYDGYGNGNGEDIVTFAANGAVSISCYGHGDTHDRHFQYSISEVLQGPDGPEWKLDLVEGCRPTLAGGHVQYSYSATLYMDANDSANRRLVIADWPRFQTDDLHLDVRDVRILHREEEAEYDLRTLYDSLIEEEESHREQESRHICDDSGIEWRFSRFSLLVEESMFDNAMNIAIWLDDVPKPPRQGQKHANSISASTAMKKRRQKARTSARTKEHQFKLHYGWP